MHKLDPRVKIVCTLIFLISLFVQNNVTGYLLATIFLVAVITLSKVPASFIIRGLKPVLILLLFTGVMNLFFTQGGAVLAHFWVFTITEKGLRTAVYLSLIHILYMGGCAAATACDSCIYLAKYKGLEQLYPGNVEEMTKEDYISFSMKMKPYLRPRIQGVKKLSMFLEGFDRYLDCLLYTSRSVDRYRDRYADRDRTCAAKI